ncbi:MAG TPA: hypothetical protein VGD51_01845, partial [Nocardioidaceae bacterium]
LDPAFLEVMDATCEDLRQVWGTANTRTLPLSATGSAGTEAAFVNTIREGGCRGGRRERPVRTAHVRRYLLERHNLEIGAGAGQVASSVCRIGLMGHNARPDAALLVLAALEDAIKVAG